MYPLERRQAVRYRFHPRAKLQIAAAEYPGLLLEVSTHGCLFIGEGLPLLSDRQACRLSIDLAGRQDFLVIDGRVTHGGHGPVGIAFVARSETQQQSLQHLIAFGRNRSGTADNEIPALLRKHS